MGFVALVEINMTQNKIGKFEIKLIIHGFLIIGFIIGYGMLFLVAVIGINAYYKEGLIDSSQASIFMTIIPVFGVAFLIYWCLSIAKEKRCPNCKEIIQ